MKKQKPFVKMKVYEDTTTYKQAVKESEKKINIVKEALEWSAKHIDTGKHSTNAELLQEFLKQVSKL